MKKLLAILGMITCMVGLAACGTAEDTTPLTAEEEQMIAFYSQNVDAIQRICEAGAIEENADNDVIYNGLLSFNSAMTDIGSYLGTNGGVIEYSDDSDDYIVRINVNGSDHNAVVELVVTMETGTAQFTSIALASGIADGLGYGDNSKAALITRGIAEIGRLGIAMGADPMTFVGLSGIGDLVVTCASMHSRNRRAGILIGKGYTKDEAMKEVQMVVEGVHSAKAAYLLSQKYHVEMPIVAQVNEILFYGKRKESRRDFRND